MSLEYREIRRENLNLFFNRRCSRRRRRGFVNSLMAAKNTVDKNIEFPFHFVKPARVTSLTQSRKNCHLTDRHVSSTNHTD